MEHPLVRLLVVGANQYEEKRCDKTHFAALVVESACCGIDTRAGNALRLDADNFDGTDVHGLASLRLPHRGV
jgi:hypothetical protein